MAIRMHGHTSLYAGVQVMAQKHNIFVHWCRMC